MQQAWLLASTGTILAPYWSGLVTQGTRGMGLMSTQRSTLLAAAVTLALSGQAAPALAAQSTTGEQIEELIVTGIRGSLRESLETKREASAVVEALSAEDLGEFPNTNVAEAMTQVPGVAI